MGLAVTEDVLGFCLVHWIMVILIIKIKIAERTRYRAEDHEFVLRRVEFKISKQSYLGRLMEKHVQNSLEWFEVKVQVKVISVQIITEALSTSNIVGGEFR